MANEVITTVNQVTADWLTSVLMQSAALNEGAVQAFNVDTTERELSTNVRLKVKYIAGSRGNMPLNLFLKMVYIDQEDEFFGPSEVNYYIRDYVGVKGVPLLRAYDAAYSEAHGRYHILLDDVSATHIEAKAKTPTLEYGLTLAEGLAAMHASWWGKQRLETADEPIPDAEAINRFVDIAQPGADHIITASADQLEPHWSNAIRELYEKHPQKMVERTQNGNGFTLIHGDVNWNNILVPIEGNRPLYIIDRQPFNWSLTTWLGVYDLAYAMVLEWDVEIRRALEKAILKHYHEQLITQGIRGYSWEQLYNDYRLSAAMCVYVATEWCRGQFNKDTLPIWMPMLQKSMAAYDDLECGNLW
jgi:hypothetical protein